MRYLLVDYFISDLWLITYRWDDPEIVGQPGNFVKDETNVGHLEKFCLPGIVVVFGWNARLFQHILHDVRIVSKRIELAAGEIHGWEVLVVVRSQHGEEVRVFWIRPNVPVGPMSEFWRHALVYSPRTGKRYPCFFYQ